MSKKYKKERFTEFSSEYDIIPNLGELNEKYIKQFIALQTHYDIVDENFFLTAQAALTAQYESELELLRVESHADTRAKFYMAKRKISALSIYSFLKRFKWHDSTYKKLLDKQVKKEIADYFAKINEGETDYIGDFITLIAEEFISPLKQNRFIKKHRRYLSWVISEYIQDNDTNKACDKIIAVLATKRKCEWFTEEHGDYIEGLLDEFLQNFSEPEEEPEEVPPLEEIENIVEAPNDAQDAENAIECGENEDAEEDNIAEELGDLNELQALEVELAEERTGEEIKVDSENAEQLKIVVPEPPKAEAPKLALMLIPQAMPWDIIRNNAAAEPKAVKEASKDEPIKNIEEGG